MNNDIYIETDRLIIRRWNLDDVDDCVSGLNNLNVSKWLAQVPYPYTKDDAIKYFISINAHISENKAVISRIKMQDLCPIIKERINTKSVATDLVSGDTSGDDIDLGASEVESKEDSEENETLSGENE